jgi:hypothetical protein
MYLEKVKFYCNWKNRAKLKISVIFEFSGLILVKFSHSRFHNILCVDQCIQREMFALVLSTNFIGKFYRTKKNSERYYSKPMSTKLEFSVYV